MTVHVLCQIQYNAKQERSSNVQRVQNAETSENVTITIVTSRSIENKMFTCRRKTERGICVNTVEWLTS